MIIHILQEALTKSAASILLLAVIILPIMVFLEYITHYNLLERISSYFRPITRCLSLPEAAAYPLLIGMVVGVFYGGAVIIEYGRRGLLGKRDLLLLGIFLALNHAMIEDNLIFAAMGANFFLLLILRFILAVLVTRTAAFLIDRKTS